MGAVFLLVLLPVVAALGFMFKTVQGDPSVGGLLAMAMFLFMSCVIGVGALKMARGWEKDGTDH